MLRAIAALLVLGGHAMGAAARITPLERPTLPTGAGVDLFFVISGFIMVFASERLFARPGAAGEFLLRRAARVVPLYWACTTAMLILTLSSRGAAGLPEPLYIAASYLFIPDNTYGSVDGVAFPLLTLGWTLNYEMLFYLVFSAFIALPRRLATAGVQLTLLAAVFVGLLQPSSVALATWTQPIILEFALGLAIANAWRNGSRLSLGVAAGFVIGALAWVALDPAGLLSLKQTPNDMRRLVGWGLPAAMILAAALLGPWRLPARWERPADLLGDASYSLYLTHPFVLIALEHIWPRVFGARLPLLFAAVALLLAIAFAAAVNRWAERPFTAALTRRLTRPPATTLAPQS